MTSTTPTQNISKHYRYYDTLTYVECGGGDKCRIHAHDWTGVHCLSCNCELTEEDMQEKPEDVQVKSVITNCGGNKCRLSFWNGDSVHCEGCCGEAPDSE